MAFIPLALASIGSAIVPLSAPAWMGVAAGAAIVGGAGAMVGSQMSANNKAVKSSNAAAAEAQQRNQAAIAEVKSAQSNASTQAQASITAKRKAMARSQTVFTNPLGIADQASTAKKTLLGE